jgi:hypothetical protein
VNASDRSRQETRASRYLRYDGGVKSALVALVATGCTFSVRLDGTSDGAIADASQIDAMQSGPADAVLPIDAGPDAMPSWVQLESVVVPCTGSSVMSTTVLEVGVTYRLRASGTCISNSAFTSRADAEYAGYNIGIPDDKPGGTDLGIAINDTTVGASKMPDWGPYTSSHEYTGLWVGLGAPITLMFHDPDFSNNSGMLAVAIDVYQ